MTARGGMRRRLAVVCMTVAVLLPGAGWAAPGTSDASARGIAAGQAAYDKGDLHGAVTAWNAVLPDVEAAGDTRSVARVLFLLGISYFQLNDFPHPYAWAASVIFGDGDSVESSVL